MLLALVVLLIGVVVGWARGGSLERLGRLPLGRRRLVVAAVVVQLLGAVVGGPAYPVGLAASALLVAAFLARNRGVRGTGLVAAGLLANALVVGLNGAMPVSVAASDRAGLSTQAILSGADPRHELADRHTRLRPLGDIVPVLLPVRPEVVSPGDVLVVAGLAQLLVVGMGRRQRPSGLSRPGSTANLCNPGAEPSPGGTVTGGTMAKRGRKRRGRKKNAANHGKRPNA